MKGSNNNRVETAQFMPHANQQQRVYTNGKKSRINGVLNTATKVLIAIV